MILAALDIGLDVDIAAILVALLALAAGWNSWRAKKAAQSADVQATAANAAVNNVPDGERTLMQRVGDLEATSHWTANAICKIANNVGIDVDDPPEQERRTQT